MNKTVYPFGLRMFEAEAKVRGLFITVSCDFDMVVSHIIAKCEEPEPSKRDTLILKLPYEIGKKLKRCKKDLEKYSNDYYIKYLPEFEAMEELLMYRNMLAHGFSQYDENKIDESFIIFIWKDEGKFKFDKVILRPFYQNIIRFRKHLSTLYELHYTMTQERG